MHHLAKYVYIFSMPYAMTAKTAE
ncbi:protein of unknown function [Burkholderia multivorans]